MERLAGQIDPAAPYFTAHEPWLLYGAVPMSIAGSMALVMGPGLLLTLGLGWGRDLWSWLLSGFLTSFVLVSVTAAVAQTLIGSPLVGAPFAVTTLLLFVPGWFVCRRRALAGSLESPLAGRSALIPIALFAVPVLLGIALTPKIFWEAMNGDGSHGYESARLLLHHGPLPFWPRDAGLMAGWPGINGLTYAYPPSWFIRLFGENAAAPRLSFLLFVPLLVGGLAAVAEAGRERRISAWGFVLTNASVVGFSLVMAYSATYNPYLADLTSPGVHDAIMMAFVLGAIDAVLRGRYAAAAAFTMMTLLTTPAGLLLSGALVAGVFLGRRPLAWAHGFKLGVGLIACLAVLTGLPHALRMFGVELPGAGHEHGLANLVGRYRALALLDHERFAYAVVPCGIYPFACFAFWRRSDHATRALMVATVLCFLAYYVMAKTSLHYFVPAMVLPVAAFWRQFADRLDPLGALFCAATMAASLWLALPAEPGIYVTSREIGHATDVSQLDDYATMAPSCYRAADLFLTVLSGAGSADVPDRLYGGSAHAWIHYAHQPEAENVQKRYKLSPTGTPRPPGAIVGARNDEFVIYVLDEDAWEKDRTRHPAGSRGKDLYQIPRHILFDHAVEKRRLGYVRLSMPDWLSKLLGR